MCDNVKRCNINNGPEWGVYRGLACSALQTIQISGGRTKCGSGKYLGHTWDITLSDNDDIIGQLISGIYERIQEVGRNALPN